MPLSKRAERGENTRTEVPFWRESGECSRPFFNRVLSSDRTKEECVGNQVYLSHEQARQALFEYLEIYYNRQRRHSALGYVIPLVYELSQRKPVERNV